MIVQILSEYGGKKNLTNFLNDSGKYGQKVGDWALQAGDGLFK